MLNNKTMNDFVLDRLKDTRTLPFKKIAFIKYMTSFLIFQDMMYFTHIWRQVKGYSSNGQRSHSNNKNNKKVKLVNKFRVAQFYSIFGRKRRDIFPTLVIGEYTNRLWHTLWKREWVQARRFLNTFYNPRTTVFNVKFDPNLLAKNVITGIQVKKKKKKTL